MSRPITIIFFSRSTGVSPFSQFPSRSRALYVNKHSCFSLDMALDPPSLCPRYINGSVQQPDPPTP